MSQGYCLDFGGDQHIHIGWNGLGQCFGRGLYQVGIAQQVEQGHCHTGGHRYHRQLAPDPANFNSVSFHIPQFTG